MSVQPVIIYRLDENPYREANLLCEVEKQQRTCQANEKVIAKQLIVMTNTWKVQVAVANVGYE